MLDALGTHRASSENLECASGARALHLEFVKGRDSCICVGQQLCPGCAECGILIDSANRDEMAYGSLEVVELRDSVAEFCLVHLEAGFIKFRK